MQTNLADLQVGDRARIVGFNTILSGGAYQNRLLSLGLVPETEFTVVRVAPFGDPIEIRIRNSSLCIRKQEGSILQLERIGKEKYLEPVQPYPVTPAATSTVMHCEASK